METKALEEIGCTDRFLPFFNKENLTNFCVIKKSDSQSEQNGIDVFAYTNENDCLRIQVRFADYGRIGQFKRDISEHEKGKIKDIPCTGFRCPHDVKIVETCLSG